MGEFFNGWRRKAGLVTLAMACLLIVGWMRSGIIRDHVIIRFPESVTILESCHGRFALESYDQNFFSNTALGWETRDASVHEGVELHEDYRNSKWRWKWKCGGFVIGADSRYLWHSRYWVAPYWSLVLPLTWLSARLILGKRPKAKPATS